MFERVSVSYPCHTVRCSGHGCTLAASVRISTATTTSRSDRYTWDGHTHTLVSGNRTVRWRNKCSNVTPYRIRVTRCVAVVTAARWRRQCSSAQRRPTVTLTYTHGMGAHAIW